MEISYLKTLELPKIIERAAAGCVCKEARAKMLELTPQCDADEVRFALDQTDAVNSLLIKNGSPRFGGVEGVSALAARAVKGGVLSMGELLQVAGALRNFQNLSAWYGSTDHDALPTDDLFYALAPQPGLEQQISDAILAPDTMADTASHTLAELRKKIRATENSIRDRLEGLVHNMESSKYLQEAVVSIRNGRYVVPVKSEYRGEINGIIHDVSSTGATVFVEPQAVVEANARILQYRAQEAQEIERILTAFTGQVAAIEPQFQYSYQAMLEIDILLAKARMALEMKAFKPAVSYDGSFSLVRARHPLIDPAKCVPVDIALGADYDALIITGPNTGGKTVTLKTAGLLCAMAQCGFLIPADERSEVCVFQEYLVDIGDEQSIEQSLSTFSGHMTKITGILELAAPGTLVLLDELGAGTDPAEGAALAVAIIEELRRRGVLLMATTHYAELKVFALETPGVVNASCEFDLETLRPTYKLSVGVPGKSNAFLISEKLGIPALVVAPESHEALVEMIELLGKALGAEDAAAALTGYYDEQLERMAALTEGAEKPTVYMASNSSYMSCAPAGMYQNYLVETAGGVNAAASQEGDYWTEVSYEDILAMAPEVIVVPSGAEYTAADVLADAQLAGVPAVENGKVYQMPAGLEEWDSPIPSGILGCLWLTSVLHPEEYPFETFTADAADFYQTFYGFAVDESLITK